MKKVFLKTFGCQMNDRDSEIIRGLLMDKGFEVVGKEQADDADVILFNTCSVRQHAEEKVWSEIGRILKLKAQNSKLKTKTQNLKLNKKPVIGLIGCMAENYGEGAFKRMPGIDLVIGPNNIDAIPLLLKQALNQRPASQDRFLAVGKRERDEFVYKTNFRQEKDHAYVVISEGCNNFCSYCVVPYVRGMLRNRHHESIIAEIKKSIAKGIRRFTLLGQNVNAYYSGTKKFGFSQLLEMIDGLEGLEELTFITSHPKDASVKLFKAMDKLEKVKKTLHLPIQSGSDRILRLMNRGYTRRQYLDLAKEYRKIVPNGMLSTDIIVGFPTETEKDFSDTCDLMKKVKFNSAYIFKYSPRPHTEAQRLPDDVPKAEKERRHKILLDYQKGLHILRGLAFGLLAAASLLICVSSYAALDIFDRPKDAQKKAKIAQKKDEVTLLDYSRECFLKGDYSGAFNSCRKLASYPPAQRFKDEILYLQGLCSLKMGRFLEARGYFNDVLLLEKEDLKADASLGIADAYFLEGSFDKAYEAYNQVLTRYPLSPREAMIFYRLGEVSYKIGRPEEARRYLNKLGSDFPLSFETRLSKNLGDQNIAPTRTEEFSSIQVGCFNEKSNADNICEALIKKGFDAYIVESQNTTDPRFKVKVGRLHSSSEADALESRLKKEGYSTKICP